MSSNCCLLDWCDVSNMMLVVHADLAQFVQQEDASALRPATRLHDPSDTCTWWQLQISTTFS